MVFVKISHGTQKYHKCCFLEYKEGWLELIFGGSFCKLHLDVFTQVITREEFLIYHECYVCHYYFKHS